MRSLSRINTNRDSRRGLWNSVYCYYLCECHVICTRDKPSQTLYCQDAGLSSDVVVLQNRCEVSVGAHALCGFTSVLQGFKTGRKEPLL